MKKNYLILLCLLFRASVFPAVAQVSFVSTDSTLTVTTALPSILDTNRVEMQQKQPTNSLINRRIPVKAGDSITISATVLDKTRRGRQFWATVARVVTPGFVVGLLGAKKDKEPTSGDRVPEAPTTLTTTLAITPGTVNWLKRSEKLKTFIGVAVYDTSGRQLTNIISRMSKGAVKTGRSWK